MTDSPKREALPKWLREDGQARERVRKSRKHEKRIAGAMGGKRIAASGARAIPGQGTDATGLAITPRGDIATPLLHIEHKYVEASTESIGVSRKRLKKVVDGAHMARRVPAMILTFEGAKWFPQDWVLVPMSFARERLGLPDEPAP